MPNREFHNFFTRLLTGVDEQTADVVNSWVDSPLALALWGPQHREHWGHNTRDALLIAVMTGTGWKGYVAALAHHYADNLPKEQVQMLGLLLGVQPFSAPQDQD
ncbi:MAG: hypothetical protein JRM97_09015 [Nitrososphaerota archaeon]|nr:hypothetical protein [Nitrososphaerota archaeon]